MKAVILVGGEGTRLRPLTCNMPKAMVPILNVPFLAHVINYLKGHNIDEIILAMCYLPEPIENHFGNGSEFGVRLSYVVEDSPLGTAGAVRNVADSLNETFFVLNGDVFTEIDLSAMIELHRQKGAKATIALTPVENPTIYGVVEADAEGRVQRFLEKPSWDEVTTNLINAGIYILEPEVLNYIPPRTHSMFEIQTFPLLLQKGEATYSYPSNSYWIDIGTPAKYLKLHHDLLSGKSKQSFLGAEKINTHPTAQISGPVIAGEDCTIGPAAQLVGPTTLGRGCSVGEGAVIDGVVMCHNVHLGSGAKLRNCVVAPNCSIGDNCWIGEECVLGDNVIIEKDNRLAQGTKVWPNRKLEPNTISF
jgi:mannose-1-phosphate guanylyltransferase